MKSIDVRQGGRLPVAAETVHLIRAGVSDNTLKAY